MDKQVNPYQWQVNMVVGTFKSLHITPTTTDKEIRYSMGQQWAMDVLRSWLKAGRRELFSLSEVSMWESTFNVPVLDLDTPMNVIMFWAGVKSIITYIANNTLD